MCYAIRAVEEQYSPADVVAEDRGRKIITFVRFTLKVFMQTDGDFVDVIVPYSHEFPVETSAAFYKCC